MTKLRHNDLTLGVTERFMKALSLWAGSLAVMALLLSGCAQTTGGGDPEAVPASAATTCTDPRPMVCTMEYRPVCADLVAGAEKTYPSGCNACADVAVASWRDGPCEEP